MLIVLRKLLELVLMVREASVNAEIPADRPTGDKINIITHARRCDRRTDGRRDERM